MSDTLRNPRAYLQKRVALLALDLNVSAEGEPLWSSTRVSNLVVAPVIRVSP